LTAIAPSSSQGTIVGCVFMDFQFGCHPLLSSSLWSPSSPLLPSSSWSSPFVSIVVAVLAFVAIVVTVLPVVSHCRRSPHLRRDRLLHIVVAVDFFMTKKGSYAFFHECYSMVTYFAIASQAFAIAESVCDNSIFLRIYAHIKIDMRTRPYAYSTRVATRLRVTIIRVLRVP